MLDIETPLETDNFVQTNSNSSKYPLVETCKVIRINFRYFLMSLILIIDTNSECNTIDNTFFKIANTLH